MMKLINYIPLKFKPEKDLYVIPLAWVLLVGSLSAATYLATSQRGGLYFILYAILGATIFGVALPAFWELIKNNGNLENLGITKKNLVLSLLIQLIIFFALYFSKLSILSSDIQTLAPYLALVLTIGFFEAFFWRGWMINKLERSFGSIPSVLISSILYSIYHIGYGMNMGDMLFLFFIGLMFALIYLVTRNIFILWPLFQPFGQLLTITKDSDLSLPLIATIGFTEVLAAMVLIIFFMNKNKEKLSTMFR